MAVEQADFVNAYLNGDLPDSPALYMRQPEGFVDPAHAERVLRLRKALYGLVQAGLIWHDTLDAVATSSASGHVASSADPSVYVKLDLSPSGAVVSRHIVCNYVDDMLTAATDATATAEFKALLRKHFELKDLGEPAFLLGVNISRDDKGGFNLSMHSYINSMLERFDMTACRSAHTPMEVRLVLDKLEDVNAGPDHQLFQSLLGSTGYACIAARPDIAFAQCFLGQHNVASGPPHLDAVKRVLRYLKTSKAEGLYFPPGGDLVLRGYTDASHGGDATDRRAVGGYLFFLGESLISWSSKKLPVIGLSSAENEYMQLTLAVKEAIWLRRLLRDMGEPQISPTPIYTDSLSALAMANPRAPHHSRTKHIDVQWHWVRERIRDNEVALVHVDGRQQMAADGMTKSLPPVTHSRLVDCMRARYRHAFTTA
jgi:hypothetical protein